MLNPILVNTNVILNNYSENRFTIGVYLDFYRHEPNNYSKIELTQNRDNTTRIKDYDEIDDKGILVFRDDYQFENKFFLIRILLDSNNVSGPALEIKSAIVKSLKNVSFQRDIFEAEGKLYTLICSDMPQVCSDDEASGVMFIIVEGDYKPEEDLHYLLRIFTRLTANYVYKYNECVLNQIISKKNEQPVIIEATVTPDAQKRAKELGIDTSTIEKSVIQIEDIQEIEKEKQAAIQSALGNNTNETKKLSNPAFSELNKKNQNLPNS